MSTYRKVHDTHTYRHTCILWSISLLLRGAYCGCGDSLNNRFFPLCHPGLQAHYTDWSIQPNLVHNTQDPRSVCMCVCVRECVFVREFITDLLLEGAII